jgi:amino acid transporter
MTLASSGPTQSVAVSLAAILATVAYAGFLPILIRFIPMLGIALGYQRLNAWHTSAGATYSWVGRALNPHAGFLAGWLMLMYYTVGTTSLTVPLGTNAGNILAFVGDKIAGGFWKNVMIVAVLGGTLASLQAAIASSARISFASTRGLTSAPRAVRACSSPPAAGSAPAPPPGIRRSGQSRVRPSRTQGTGLHPFHRSHSN